MRSLVLVSMLGALSIVACSGGAADPKTETGGSAATGPKGEAPASATPAAAITDALAKKLVGTWDRISFISKRKDYKSIVFHKSGTYDATKNDDSNEHGTFAGSASEGTVTLASASGERVFNTKVENGSELFMSLTGDPLDSDDSEVFMLNEEAVDEEPGGEPGSGLDVACEARTGGAFITIETTGKPYKVWSTNAAFITRARSNMESGISKVAMFKNLTKGSDCDSGIGLAPDPNEMSWVDTAVEICDAEPDWLNDNVDYMIDTIGYWCPWHTKVTAVDER